MMMIKSLFVVINLIFSCSVFATDVFNVLRSDHSYERYFQIEIIENKEKISLLNWRYNENKSYNPPADYQRTKHFKGWIRDPSHTTCLNVRNLILYRQSQGAVVYNPKNQCEIFKSKWYDPYSDKYLYWASDIDIDHIVPLKNAYYSGASSWSHAKRCHYANFLADPYHLLAVESSENRSKGNSDPSQYLPMNTRFQCLYISIWLRIKALWNLKIAMEEANAIHSFLTQNSCPVEFFSIDSREFSKIQNQIQYPPQECQ